MKVLRPRVASHAWVKGQLQCFVPGRCLRWQRRPIDPHLSLSLFHLLPPSLAHTILCSLRPTPTSLASLVPPHSLRSLQVPVITPVASPSSKKGANFPAAEDGGDGGGDGGTPAPKIHKPDDQVLATRPSTGPAAEAPADSTLVAKEHDHTLQQLEMIKAKVLYAVNDHALYSTCPPPPPRRRPRTHPVHAARALFTPASRPVYASPRLRRRCST